MCYRPIHIHASTGGYIGHDVPCGKCESCLQQKRDSYTIRAYQDYVNYHCQCAFLTLTYNNANLPQYTSYRPVWTSVADVPEADRLNYICSDIFQDSPLNSPETVSCWNKVHLQKLLKGFNEWLLRLVAQKRNIQQTYVTPDKKRRKTKQFLDMCKEVGRPLRYLVTCERGETDVYTDSHGHLRYGTHRPHYHVILFVIPSCPELSNFTYDDINKYIKNHWKYGFCYNELVGREGNPQKALEYVCKYITKDITDNLIEYFMSEEDRLKYKPFTLISNYFGGSFFENFEFTQENMLDLYDKGFLLPSSNGSSRSVPIPSYYSYKYLNTTEIVRPANPAEYRPATESIVLSPSYHGLPLFGDPSFVDIKYYKDTFTVTQPTPEGQTIRDILHSSATDFYLRYLDILCTLHPSELDTFDPHILPKGSFTRINSSSLTPYQYLCNLDRDRFYTYLLQERNILYDPTRLPLDLELQQLETGYFILQKYKSYYQKQKQLKQQINDKCSLLEAFKTSPELFTKLPL